MLYPLTFKPILKERIWGGRKLEQLYGKPLPPAVPIGESWEISDRPGDVSQIANGPLVGRDLRWLIQHHERELLGPTSLAHARFPLLIKVLDAAEKLSLQVHPPASVASALHGEPKTEMWYIAEAAPGAELYVGLKRGTTRREFEQKVQQGSVADCFHRIKVQPGDGMFLPSGRVHAIGAGLVIFEIQQNSDTTYRVFDWNRVGIDGKPRALHLAESLASIDFNDFEPAPVRCAITAGSPVQVQSLVCDPLFNVDAVRLEAEVRYPLAPGRMHIVGVVRGSLTVQSEAAPVLLGAGQFALVPASLGKAELRAQTAVTVLRIE